MRQALAESAMAQFTNTFMRHKKQMCWIYTDIQLLMVAIKAGALLRFAEK